MPTSTGKVCRFPDGSTTPITGSDDYSSCDFQGGVVGPADAGNHRFSTGVLGSALRAPATPDEVGGMLLTFPLCELTRRLPHSPIMAALDRLDSTFSQELARLMQDDPQLQDELVRFVIDISSLGAVALASDGGGADGEFPVPEALLTRGRELGRRVQGSTQDEDLVRAVEELTDLSSALDGLPVSRVLSMLAGDRAEQPLRAESPSASWRSAAAARGLFLGAAAVPPHGAVLRPSPAARRLVEQGIEVFTGGSFAEVAEQAAVADVLAARATALGYGAQDQHGDVEAVPGGYVARYPGHDIYAAPGALAYEVHGDIRAKYLALGGAAGALGLPATDETATPDGVGRFNHFRGGSIYWTPRTGPMSVSGAVRNRWAAMGWEAGPLGYPVRDQYRMATLGPTQPVQWCLFEHGVVAANAETALPAPAALQTPAELAGRFPEPARLTYDQLAGLLGARLNKQFIASPDNVAMRPGVDLLGVTDWEYDFWWSRPRTVGFRYRGFHDNGLAPDTGFIISIALRFSLVWSTQGFTEPTAKSLVAELAFLRVISDGDGVPYVDGQVLDGVRRAIAGSFAGPDPARPEVPRGSIFLTELATGADARTGSIDVLDVAVTASGDLQVLVNPLGPLGIPADVNLAYVRQSVAQSRLDAFLGAG